MNMSAPALLWLVPFPDALASSSNFLSIDTYASRRLSGDQLIAPDQSCLIPDAMTSEVPASSESNFSLFEASVKTALYSLSKTPRNSLSGDSRRGGGSPPGEVLSN